MAENKKPRLCEMLGVDVNEEFRVKDSTGTFRINQYGFRERFWENEREHRSGWDAAYNEQELTELINSPEEITIKPRFSEDEKAVLRLLKKAGYTSLSYEQDEEGAYISLEYYGELHGTCELLAQMFHPFKGTVTLDEEVVGNG